MPGWTPKDLTHNKFGDYRFAVAVQMKGRTVDDVIQQLNKIERFWKWKEVEK